MHVKHDLSRLMPLKFSVRGLQFSLVLLCSSFLLGRMTLWICWCVAPSLQWYAGSEHQGIFIQRNHNPSSMLDFRDVEVRGRPASTTFLKLLMLTDVRNMPVGIFHVLQ